MSAIAAIRSRRLPLAAMALVAFSSGDLLFAQGTITTGSQRPFVTGFVPVVGRGAVGGVSVDAKGIVNRSSVDASKQLRKARLKALRKLPADMNAVSKLRKISLRRLDAALAECRKKGRPVTGAMRNLAGLQRIRYVFVYPKQRDIVLAGEAEGWTVDRHGIVVGRTTGKPTLQLDDLLVALRTAKAAETATISCSIDPTKRGVAQLNRLLRTRGLRMNRATIKKMEHVTGPQQITLTGVPATSRFARVMVAADVRMKRLAMGLEASPVSGLPSYLQLVKSKSRSTPRTGMPRWWLAPRYEPLRRDAKGLAWELRGAGVQTLTDKNAGPRAKQWAELMTAKFPSLSAKAPIFAELRNCMDLAVVAALIAHQNLQRRAGGKFHLLMDGKKLQIMQFPAPKSIPSQASVLRNGRDWIISVSGGVEIDSWGPNDKPQVHNELADNRKALPANDGRWWWD